MTAQISDTFLYRDNEYSLVGLDSMFSSLISPEQFGMKPSMMSTACYRGFYATYEITDRLLLQSLTIREESGNYLPINGVVPDDADYSGSPRYTGINLPVWHSGVLRLGKGFIRDLYVHMGFPKPSAFETVIDVELSDGVVVGVRDRSEEAAHRRGEFKRWIEANPGKGVPDSFSLDLDIW